MNEIVEIVENCLEGEIQQLNQTEEEGILLQGEDVKEPSLLHNRKEPWYYNKHERPVHRQMIALAAQGFSVKEIAQMTGHTTVNVNNILRLPQLQQTLVNEIHEKVSEDKKVLNIVRDSVVMAIETLRDIAGGKIESRPSDRLAAAKEILDRRYGKTNQPINRGSEVDLNSLSDADLLAMRGN